MKGINGLISKIPGIARDHGIELGRYGENWHQKAHLLIDEEYPYATILKAKQVHGGSLGYNNYLDSQGVFDMILEFRNSKEDFVTVVKHSNPCGASTAPDQATGLERAMQGDPISAFGGLIGFNKEVSLDTMKMFYERPGEVGGNGWVREIIIAPGFSEDAMRYVTNISNFINRARQLQKDWKKADKKGEKITSEMIKEVKDLYKKQIMPESDFLDYTNALFKLEPVEINNLLEYKLEKDPLKTIKKLWDGVSNKGKTNLRLLDVGDIENAVLPPEEIRSLPGGNLVQDRNNKLYLPEDGNELFEKAKLMYCENSEKNLKVGVVTDTYADSSKLKFVEFGIFMSRCLKSNAVCVAREYQDGYFELYGFDTGQQNRIDSTDRSIERLKRILRLEFKIGSGKGVSPYEKNLLKNQTDIIKQNFVSSGAKTLSDYMEMVMEKDCGVFSEAFFPDRRNITDIAKKTKIKLIVQPGGSLQDKAVIKECNKHNIAMIYTGVRQFRH